jgi:ferredoxin
MIALVIITLLIYRGAQQNTGVFPCPDGWAFASWAVAQILHPLGYGVNSVLEVVFILGHLTWKGMLDLGTCTECGRCQSQCPAWATGKPLSPKQLILDLRDHAFAKAPYLLADEEGRVGLSAAALAEAERPLVGDEAARGVIDPEVL